MLRFRKVPWYIVEETHAMLALSVFVLRAS